MKEWKNGDLGPLGRRFLSVTARRFEMEHKGFAIHGQTMSVITPNNVSAAVNGLDDLENLRNS